VDVDRIARLEPASVHAAFYLPVGSPVVGNVGALAAHKGHRHLVDAAVLVRRELPDARFVIVGDGDQRTSLERHIRDAGLERHVFLAGFRADVLEMIGGFDLFAAAPLHEGMCLPLVDAMAAGKAAVATRAGGIPEVMVDGTTGFLVEPRDHRAMAERIVQLLRDERLRARLGAAAQARAREHFSIIRMVEGTAAVYDAVSTMRNRSRSAAR
jgi:glycosyltransferase involved in cell wall biosynthesis